MGKSSRTDKLRWYEVVFCCCKCRGECKACLTTTCLYYVPIILLLALAGVCITIGVMWRADCPYKTLLPYWVMISSVTPFILLCCIKGMHEPYYGMTLWRLISIATYLLFTTWIIIGSVWILDTWMNASDTTCNNVLQYFSFILVIVHWLFFVLSTLAQTFIMTRICCCCTENAIKPLKGEINTDGADL